MSLQNFPISERNSFVHIRSVLVRPMRYAHRKHQAEMQGESTESFGNNDFYKA